MKPTVNFTLVLKAPSGKRTFSHASCSKMSNNSPGAKSNKPCKNVFLGQLMIIYILMEQLRAGESLQRGKGVERHWKGENLIDLFRAVAEL